MTRISALIFQPVWGSGSYLLFGVCVWREGWRHGKGKKNGRWYCQGAFMASASALRTAFPLSRASCGEQEFPQEDLPGGDSLSSEKDQQSTKLKVYFSKYYLANNFAKTNICCAFLESEKANFHFLFLPSLFYSTSFSSPTHQVSSSTFTDTIAITTTPHFESLAFLSTSGQEFLLEGLQNS